MYIDGMEKINLSKNLQTEVRKLLADNPLAGLEEITRLRHTISEQEREAVFLALDQGHSWREIGEALGVSKQAAFQRFGREWVTRMTKIGRMDSTLKQTIKRRLTE